MNASYPFDPALHEPGSVAARGGCSHHAEDSTEQTECSGEAVVSFEGEDGTWRSGCSLALEALVEHGDIEPLGQGA